MRVTHKLFQIKIGFFGLKGNGMIEILNEVDDFASTLSTEQLISINTAFGGVVVWYWTE